MGKHPKWLFFFYPLNPKNEKNEIAYHVGNIFSKILPPFFLKKCDFDVIMTS
jgi:hypothetical protein